MRIKSTKKLLFKAAKIAKSFTSGDLKCCVNHKMWVKYIDFSASGVVPRRSVEMTSNANHGLKT